MTAAAPQKPLHMGVREWAILLLLSVIWGASFFFYRVMVRELQPLTIVLGRLAIGAVAVVACGLLMPLPTGGPGIPPQDLDRIFDKFYRVQAGDQKRAGTGLGLAIARGFIEAMGGTLRAGNRADGTGAVFTITLPVPQAQGAAA